MITVKLYTGQVLTFPDGTPESVIRAAAARATQAAKSSKSSLDLSSLRDEPSEQVPIRDGFRLSQDNQLKQRQEDGFRSWYEGHAKRLGLDPNPDDPRHHYDYRAAYRAKAEPDPETGHWPSQFKTADHPNRVVDGVDTRTGLPERSPEFWRSVSGSPSSKAEEYSRQSELRAAEESGAGAMASLGFEDRETYYYNPATDERVPKKRKTGNLPGSLDAGYRPESATDRLHKIYEAEGRPVPTSEELEARGEFVRGIPSRVMGSMAGLALPFQAIESVGRGLKEEARNLVTGEHIGRPTGEGLHRGARQGWTESPITRGAAVIQEEVVEPARERYLDAAIRAGMSPESAALAETGQMVAGEALNPGNYIGLEMLRTGAQMSRTTPAAIARRSAQESVGGARALEEAGIVTGEYGRGSAPSEIAQAKAARSGDFLPGANEPWLYRDPKGTQGTAWKGVIPDAVREVAGRPWRMYGGELPIERPVGNLTPRPRSVNRPPIDMPIVGGSVDDQARIGGLWDYASRRYPRIASTVNEVRIGETSYFEPGTGTLSLAPDADLGVMMHELTHAAQEARGQFGRPSPVWDDSADSWVGGPPLREDFEPVAVRAGDVYSRISQPQPRRLQEAAADLGQQAINPAGDDMSERFASFLSRAGIEDPDRYYDLDPAQRAILDRQFAANDAGPDTVAWSAYLLEHNLRPDDYTNMSLPDRMKVESEFRMQMAQQAKAPDPHDGLPDYFYDANSGGWKVDGSDQVFEKEWQAQEFRESFRVFADQPVDQGSGSIPVPGKLRPSDAPTLFARVPRWAADHADAIARQPYFVARNRGRYIKPEDLPIDIDRDLPLIRWERTRNAANERRQGATFWLLGDDAHYAHPGDMGSPELNLTPGGDKARVATFRPSNPLVMVYPGKQAAVRSGISVGEMEGQIAEHATLKGHDSIIFLKDRQVEVVTLPGAKIVDRPLPPGLEAFQRASPQLQDALEHAHFMRQDDGPRLAAIAAEHGAPLEEVEEAYRYLHLRGLTDERVDLAGGLSSITPAPLPQRIGLVTRELADRVREGITAPAGARGGPFRAYADQGLGAQVPAAIAPALPEEHAARAMGWLRPPGSPRAVGPPIKTPEFQTNIAAQLGGDEMLAHWIVEQSDAIVAAKGPPQTFNTLEEMAVMSGKSKEEILESSWHIFSPELRLRWLMIAKAEREKLAGLHDLLVQGKATDSDKAEILRLIDAQGDFIRLGAKSGSAYGRALNSAKIEARLSLGEDQLLRQKLYRQYEKQIDADRPLLDALARLDPSNPEELQAFLRAVNKPSFREYLQEYWVASILSGPATHERNLIGNAVNAVIENAVVRPLAAGFDAARVAGTGADRAIYLSETPAAIIGLTRGIRQGARRGLEVLKRGYDPETMKGKMYPVRSSFARSQNRVVRETVGPVVTMPLRLLAASDALFKTMNWNAEIYAQAARAASKKGLSGDAWGDEVARLVANPTDEMIEAADDFALKATFNDEASALGKAIMNLRDLPGLAEPKSTVGKLGVETYRGIAGFVLPFIKIADRLMVRGFEYTPVGTLKSVGARQAGNFVESADLAARSAIGSVVMAYAASLAMEGRLTAAAPSDEAEKAAFFGAGKQAWSVRTDDGLWIPYGGLQPVGTPFALAASFWKGWTENEESPSDERLAWGAQQVGQYVTDQSYMDGLSKLIEAISGGKGQAGRAGADMITNTAWGFAPYSGLTRSIAKGVDPRVIDAERIADRLWQNVPGVSLGMDARLTPWGEEVVPVGGRLRSGLAPGSILLPSKERPNPLDQELDRLGMPLGYVGKTLSDKLKGEVRSKGSWKLTPDEWYYYQQTAGRAARAMLQHLYAKPGYTQWDIEKQREETEKAIGAAREYARILTVRFHRRQGPRGKNPSYADISSVLQLGKKEGA